MFTDNLRKAFSGLSKSLGEFLGKKVGMSANFATFLVLLFGIISAYFVYVGNFYIAILFFLISGVMDFVDGSIAKSLNKQTKFGGLLDSTTDKLTEILIYIAIGLNNSDLWLPAVLCISFFMLSSYISKHAKASGGESGGGIIERKERIILIILALAFFNFAYIPLYIIAVFSLITAIQRFCKNYKILK
jgi:phosphatidylglycerophosphate synthase